MPRGDDAEAKAPAALDHPEHRRLGFAERGRCRATVRADGDVWRRASGFARLAAPGSLVDLNVAGQRLAVVAHQRPDALHHLVRLLVRDADLALHLLGRDAAASASHQIHRVEPQVQRRGRALKDRALLRVDVQAARVARVGRPGLGAVELALALAARAVGVRAVRGEAVSPEPVRHAASSGKTCMNSISE